MKKALDEIRKYRMIAKHDCVVVGVSGGADSVCLLSILLDYQKEQEFSIVVVHIEHGIRGDESLRDAAHVEKLCKEWGVPFRCFHYDIPEIARERKISEEEAGRLMRYEAFEMICKEWNAQKIAVAHNRNDQAETILWNICRGSGMRGAAGIRPVRGKVIRPLLAVSRAEIEAFLKERQIEWCEDQTNKELEYTRNIIRNRIFPILESELNSSAMEHFAVLGEELGEAENYIQRETEKKYALIVKEERDSVRIGINEFQDCEKLIRERLIRESLVHCGCGLKDITRTHITQICELAQLQSGKMICLPGGYEAEKEFSEIRIGKVRREAESEELPLTINGETKCRDGVVATHLMAAETSGIVEKTYTKWLNYDIIKDSLVIRTRRPGDYIVINQAGQHKKLKQYLTEEKIPVSERDRVKLIAIGSEILWVIGYRISDAYKVYPETEQMIEITFKEDK